MMMSDPNIQAQMNTKQRSLFSIWKETNWDEIWLYICICLLMGIVHKPTSMHIGHESIFSVNQYLIISCDVTDSSNWQRWSILLILSMKTLMMIWKSCDSFLSICNQNLKKPIRQKTPCHWGISFFIKRMAEVQNLHLQQEGKIWGKIFVLCKGNTGYLLNYIVYVGATSVYRNAPANLQLPSKAVLSLLHCHLNKGCCVTWDNYHTSPELGKALTLNVPIILGHYERNPIFQMISGYGSQSMVIRQKQSLTKLE